MLQFQNTYAPAGSAQPMMGRPLSQTDWSAEITPMPQEQMQPDADTGTAGMGTREMTGISRNMNGTQSGMNGGMAVPGNQMPQNNGEMARTGLPSDVIEAPETVDEAYRGSLKAMLNRYIGSYVVATFLVGTQGTISWEGVLFDVGNDFVTIYQQARDRYIVSDIYSLKYIEFYDTQRREMCEALLRQNGWQNN